MKNDAAKVENKRNTRFQPGERSVALRLKGAELGLDSVDDRARKGKNALAIREPREAPIRGRQIGSELSREVEVLSRLLQVPSVQMGESLVREAHSQIVELKGVALDAEPPDLLEHPIRGVRVA